MPPVIAIDGPSASGKGTVAQRVAQALQFHYLDSGALYRGVALAAAKSGTKLVAGKTLERLAATMDISFVGENIFLNQMVVTDELRSEAVSEAASIVGAIASVRLALIARQRAFCQPPGLVADGRDMGSTIFPAATLKIYLTADADERARRRYKQLIAKGLNANMATLLQDILARDERDSERVAAPLQKCKDAIVLDTTNLSIDAAVEQVLAQYAAVKQES